LNHYSLADLPESYGQKYDDDSYFYVLKSMTYFVDAEEEPSPIILNGISWEVVKVNQVIAAKTQWKS
jgi:hypothetical protein